MICLCCRKIISENASITEKETLWHDKCVTDFFGVKTLPLIDVSDDMLKKIAYESTGKGYTVAGVQKKMSVHLTGENNNNPRLTLMNCPAGYIIKPQTAEYKCLPEAEYLVMHLAKLTGIKVVPFALIKGHDNNFLYITKRIDREDNKMLAMEDFCQLDGRLTEDKYKGSYERCAKIIKKFSSQSVLDITELFFRVIFSYCVGNSDMHLKNFSLIEKVPYSNRYILSDAYDLLPVNIVNPADKDEMALTINGKKRNIRRNDFLKLSDSCGMQRKVAENIIKKVISNKEKYIQECEKSYLTDELKEQMTALIEERCGRLSTEN